MVSATEHGLPLLVVAALWFGSTALVFRLDSLGSRTFRRSLQVAGLVAISGVALLAATAGDDGVAAAYMSFAAALAIWGWHELSFLTGAITGPRRGACPPGARGLVRFRAAAATVIHHELALAATAALLAMLAYGQPNQIGALTFALLLAMRLSAKLNIFLGVPAFAHELLPPHLGYLKSYFGRRVLNPLFPLSLALAVAATAWLGQAAMAADGGAAVGYSLLCGLAALGTLEHLFLVLPLADANLWRWARTEAKAPAVNAATID